MDAVTGEGVLEDAAGDGELAALVEHLHGSALDVRQRKGRRAGIVEHRDRENVSGAVVLLDHRAYRHGAGLDTLTPLQRSGC